MVRNAQVADDGAPRESARHPLERLGLGSLLRAGGWLDPLLVAALAAIVYWITDSERVTLDSYVPLADAFLSGRLHLELSMPWLELVPRPEGGWYSPFPPMPAIVLLPFVFLFGPGFDQGIAAALFGGLNVGLVWSLLRRAGASTQVVVWLTVAFGFGTVHWWAAGTGAVWTFAQVVGTFFALLALRLAIVRERAMLAGFFLGLAAASRLPIGLTLPLYVALYGRLGFPVPRFGGPDELRAVARLLIGLAVPAAAVALYNVVRFGSPFQFGYSLIPGVLDEPWYEHGILGWEYIPRHIHLMTMRGFDLVDTFPWFRPNWTGASVLLTTPVVLWLVKARSRQTLVAYGWIAIALAMLPNVTHGAAGFAQFGYRFIIDVLPLMLLLLAWVFRRGMSVEARAAIVLGVLVNAYGVWAVTVADFVSF